MTSLPGGMCDSPALVGSGLERVGLLPEMGLNLYVSEMR